MPLRVTVPWITRPLSVPIHVRVHAHVHLDLELECERECVRECVGERTNTRKFMESVLTNRSRSHPSARAETPPYPLTH